MIDLFPAPAVIVNAAGKIVAANKAVRKYTGYSPEDLVGKNLFEQGFFEDQTNMLLQLKMKKRLKGSYIPVSETRVKAKNGDLRFLEIKGNKIEYEGQICDLIIFYDVTERSNQRKRLQQELFESEEKSLGITNSIKDAIILVDNETKVIYWNPAAEKTFGYTIEEATGKYVHELVIPKTMCKEAKERIDVSVKVFGQTGIGYFTVGNVEVIGRRKDGSEFPAELSMSPMRLGEKWHAVGVVKDIALRIREEQKLTEAEQRYHALFNQAPLGILILDAQTTAFVEFNDGAY